MKTTFVRFSVILSAIVFGFCVAPARAQEDTGASPGQVREEVHQLIADMQNPDYDFSKIPDRLRQTFQDFRSATANMDQDTSRQFRQDLMQQLFPVLQANQEKIREAMRMAFLKSLQQPMGCTDDEFAALLPYMEKVVEASDASQINRFRPPRDNNGSPNNGNRDNRPQPNPQTESPVQQAATDLQTTVSDTSSSSDLIKNKLDILRQAQDKARQDLQVARTQLKQLLTQRQEAVLVENGLLD